MKKIIVIISILLCCVNTAVCQTAAASDSKLSGDITFGMGTTLTKSPQGLIDLRVDMNYDFCKPVFAMVNVDTDFQLADGTKRYADAFMLGGGLGWHILNSKAMKNGASYNLDLRANYGASVGRCDWKHNALTADLLWYPTHTTVQPVVGVGYRFSHGRNDAPIGMREKPHQILFSLGLRF